MKFVSPLLKRVLYPAMHRSARLAHYADSGPLAILTYHGVLPAGYEARDLRLDGSWVTARGFRDQLRYLRKRYNLVTPEQVRLWLSGQGDLPPRAVVLTCDDGLSNAVSDMLPILQSENATCLFFVTADSLSSAPGMLWYEELYLALLAAPEGPFVTDSCGVEFRGVLEKSAAQRHAVWRQLVERLSAGNAQARRTFAKALRAEFRLPEKWLGQRSPHFASRFRLLSREEIATLLAAGMSIGSHTASHPRLSCLPDDLAWSEISETRCQLERALGISVWAIAYPFGGTDSVSERELVMAEKAGHTCAFVNFGGGFGAELPRFALPRVHVTQQMSLAEFEGHLCGLHERLRRWMGYSEKVAHSPRADFLADPAHLSVVGKDR
jgi:peptidoglycan/xylan/chitin deacetylase (PgdA/CDA1 family)